ncbi:hypothetical protein [Kitasatospora sp. NPDC057223]|uniref:hypothetical protein n=1 Tax=Kitasatospora sp. NPDC057223 TaxID=3346055 RepID=UPI0036430B46
MIETTPHSPAQDAVDAVGWDGAERGMPGALPAPVVRRSPWRRPDRMRGAVLVALLSSVGATLLVGMVSFVAGHLHIAVSWH